MTGASYDTDDLKTVGNKYLPRIAENTEEAIGNFEKTGDDWWPMFAESLFFAPDPDTEGYFSHRGDMYTKSWEAWVEVCRGFRDLLQESQARIEDAAKAVVKVAEEYADAETQAVQEIASNELDFEE